MITEEKFGSKIDFFENLEGDTTLRSKFGGILNYPPSNNER